MKNWLMTIGGGLIIVLGVWLVVIFAPQVLLFLEGIVGILAGIAGAVILAIGISRVKTKFEEKKEKKVVPAKADPTK